MNKDQDSFVCVDVTGGGIAFVGRDAQALYQATTLSTALRLLSVGIKPGRGWSMKKTLAMATVYTGQRYKNSEWERARSDLKTWCELMKSSLPVVVQ